MLVSNVLSRVYTKNSKPELRVQNSLIHHVHFLISNFSISNERLEQFKEETRKDPIFANPYKVHY